MRWLAAVLVWMIAPHAFADIIEFKDGQRLRGTVTKRTPAEVTIQFDFGTTSFAPQDIVAITPEPASAVTPAAAGDAPAAAPDAPAVAGDASPAEAEDAPMTLGRAVKAVAFVAVLHTNGQMGVGSGVVINGHGAIVTNYHVVADAKEIQVLLPEDKPAQGGQPRPHEARLVKTDPCYDLALISIPRKTTEFLRFKATNDVEVGEPVRAIGNPQGLAVSVSKGIISAVRMVKDFYLGEGLGQLSIPGCEHLSNRVLEQASWVQTDAAINPGNSGGPLINEQFEIVGINSLIFSQGGGSEGLGFALHVKHARQFAKGFTGKPSSKTPTVP